MRTSIFSATFLRIKRGLQTVGKVHEVVEQSVDEHKLKKSFRSKFTSSFAISAKEYGNVRNSNQIEVIVEDGVGNVNGRKIMAVKVADQVYGVNDLSASKDPVLQSLAVQIAKKNIIHDKNGKYRGEKFKIGRGFSIDKDNNLSIRAGVLQKTIVNIGRVRTISDLESDVSQELDRLKKTAHIDVDLEKNPEKAAVALERHAADIMSISLEIGRMTEEVQSSSKIKSPDANRRFKFLVSKVSSFFYPKPQIAATQEVVINLKEAVVKAELPDMANRSDELSASTHDNKSPELSVSPFVKNNPDTKIQSELKRQHSEVQEVVEIHRRLVDGEQMNFNEILRNLDPASARQILRNLHDRVKIDTSSLADLKAKIAVVKGYDVLSAEQVLQIEKYIESKSDQEFNRGLENIYKSGLSALERAYELRDRKDLSKVEKIAAIKASLMVVKDIIYKIDLAVNHSNSYLTEKVKDSLSGLREILQDNCAELCRIYANSIGDLPYYSSELPDLSTESKFLSTVRTTFPELSEVAVQIQNLHHFALKTGLGSQIDTFKPEVKKLIIQHYEKGALLNPAFACSTAEQKMAAQTESFLTKILGASLQEPKMMGKERQMLIKSCLLGDYTFINQVLVENAKIKKGSKEFANLDGFVKGLAVTACEIRASGLGNANLAIIDNHLIEAQHSLAALRRSILPKFSVNSLNSIKLSKSLVALQGYGVSAAIRDFDLLLVQVMFEEAKLAAFTRLEVRCLKGEDLSTEEMNKEIENEFKRLVEGFDVKERAILAKINLKKIGLDIYDFTNVQTIEKLCKQGLSSTGEVQKVIKRSNAVAASIARNQEMKGLLSKNLLLGDEEHLTKELTHRTVSKLFGIVYASSEQLENLVNSLSARRTGRIGHMQEDIRAKTALEQKLERRSKTVQGIKVGRVATNIMPLGIAKVKVHVTDKSGAAVKLKTEARSLGDVLHGLEEGVYKKAFLDKDFAHVKEMQAKQRGVVAISARERENYEKQKKISGKHKGKTSNRIINNYFVLKAERDDLEAVRKGWNSLRTPQIDDINGAELEILKGSDVVSMFSNKQHDIYEISKNRLDGYYSGPKLSRVDKDGNIGREGEYLAVTATFFKNGARLEKPIGFVDLSDPASKELILRLASGMGHQIDQVIQQDPRFLSGLHGFNTDTLHRSDDPKKSRMSLKILNSLENPENVHRLQRIRNQAFLVDFQNEKDLVDNPELMAQKYADRADVGTIVQQARAINMWQEQSKNIDEYNNDLLDLASGNLKEAFMLVRIGIIHGFAKAFEKNPEINFKQYLDQLHDDAVRAGGSENIYLEEVLTKVGLDKHLAPLCLYEVEKMSSMDKDERVAYLYACYEDVHLSEEVESKKAKVEAQNVMMELDNREDALVKKVNTMEAGSKLTVKDSFEVNLTFLVSEAAAMAANYTTAGLAALVPQLSVYKDSAFTLMKQRDGKVAVVLNQEQGQNFSMSANFISSFARVGASVSGGYDTGVKFEFAGKNAGADAVAFCRKLLEGKEVDIDDLTRAQSVDLVNGICLDTSVAAMVAVPKISDIMGVSTSHISSARDFTAGSEAAEDMVAFSSQAISGKRKSVSKRRNCEEVNLSETQIFYVREDTGNAQIVSDKLGGPACDMFYKAEKSTNTGTKDGFVTHHNVEYSISLSHDNMSSSNESKYLENLYKLMTYPGESHLLYDRQFLQEIEDVMRNNSGEKNLIVKRELKAEALEVVNMRVSAYMAGEISKQQMNEQVSRICLDERNTQITSICVSVVKVEEQEVGVMDSKNAALTAGGVISQSASVKDTQIIALKRIEEIRNNPDLATKLVKAEMQKKVNSAMKNAGSAKYGLKGRHAIDFASSSKERGIDKI